MKGSEGTSSADSSESKGSRKKGASMQSGQSDIQRGADDLGASAGDGGEARTRKFESRAEAVGGEVDEARDRLLHMGEAVRSDANALAQSLGNAAQEVGTYIQQQLQERPYQTLGVAAGIGYILGGGLTLRVTSLLLGTGGRMLASMALREVMSPVTDS